jgi:hypothetical protein
MSFAAGPPQKRTRIATIAAAVVATASASAMGCAVVFGISSGEYDPDAFTLDADATSFGDASADTDAPTDAPPAPACTPLIDDFEDGDGEIIRCAQREGPWFTYNDGSDGGVQDPAPRMKFVPQASDRPGSKFAAHTSGKGFVERGAGMGLHLLRPKGADQKRPFDASRFSGVRFWAKAAAPLELQINVSDQNSEPIGGVCERCYAHFHDEVTLTTEWAQHTVLFAEMHADDWGVPKQPSIDRSRIYTIEFHTPRSATFDLWIDHVEFTP